MVEIWLSRAVVKILASQKFNRCARTPRSASWKTIALYPCRLALSCYSLNLNFNSVNPLVTYLNARMRETDPSTLFIISIVLVITIIKDLYWKSYLSKWVVDHPKIHWSLLSHWVVNVRVLR